MNTTAIIVIVAVVAVISIIVWREGGRRAQKNAREAELHREIDD
jgi:hypothetical protein